MKNLQELEELLQSYSIDGGDDWSYYIEAKDIADCSGEEAAKKIRQAIEDGNGFDAEMIYYDRAILYLKENDCSLRFSLGIASEMGYDLKNLNSEVLASLLMSENIREDFYEKVKEFISAFDDLEDEDEDEDEE